MVMKLWRQSVALLNDFLNHPLRVVGLCLFLLFVSLVLEGSLLQLWHLHRDLKDIEKKRLTMTDQSSRLEMRIKTASDPTFLEIEALNRFDLVGKGDLVFVFSNDEEFTEN